jgi:hypothetical protein
MLDRCRENKQVTLRKARVSLVLFFVISFQHKLAPH